MRRTLLRIWHWRIGHNWQFVRNIYGDEINWTNARSIYECTGCGKRKWCPELTDLESLKWRHM